MEKSFADMAEIRVSKTGRQPTVTVAVPGGLKMKDITRLLDLVSKDVLPGLVGCEACNSGCHLVIETHDDIIRVDLEHFERIG